MYYGREIVMRYKLFITHEVCRKIEYRLRGLAESIGSGNRSKPLPRGVKRNYAHKMLSLAVARQSRIEFR